MPQQFENILIIKPSSLGDIVLALPALSALRKSFPDARISWLIRPEFAPLLENHPHLDEVIIFDRKLQAKAWYNPRAAASLVSLIRQLRHRQFDCVIDLQGLFRSAFFTFCTGCRNRFGMGTSRELAHIFYKIQVPQTPQLIHLVDYFLEIMRRVGASETSVEFVVPRDEGAEDSVRQLLEQENLKCGGYALFVPGSVHADKRWPVENFAALADRVRSDFNLPVIATGTQSEVGLVEQLKAKAPVVNLAGRTSLSELIALLRFSKIVISNDTGPGHIAAALGVPLVMLFGRANPARLRPYGRDQAYLAIEPESRGFGIEDYNPRYSVHNITVEKVYQRLREQLEP